MRRRLYPLTVLASLAGSALALYAITRTWSVHVIPRPGMSGLRESRTGTDVQPWVTGLAVVALAGTGALLATSGWARRALGVLLSLAGLGVTIGAIAGRVGLDPGSAGAGGTLWPVGCAAGGLIVLAGGLSTLARGHEWPGMSARYERKPVATAPAPADHRAAWDALDRGDDPTG
ncbi:hypothetical protein GCM10010172_45980 [Paractinoplanes ferrugineus]|uniref:Membrane protein (TIGR02234 family) n=1 Tax=Paractinoplanes ferrugineus TaxID=113564 RepID=A0A919JAD9_9ACTN|nr:Trp biosynthesis-associated membrane protein [Actinoplanes ferrugineus]GIE15609.1 hypothetical protein Afe05nite_74490 [Actinoplanes ferrugineus]